jgi:phosphomannomutase
MISLGAKNYNASVGIIITASHNPPAYNGFKLKGHYGGPLLPEKIEEIEALIPEAPAANFKEVSLAEAEANGSLKWVPLEDDYCTHVERSFDLDAIRNSSL